MFTKNVLLATAAASLALAGSQVQAKTYNLGALTAGTLSTISTITTGSGTVTDYFDFEVTSSDVLFSASSALESGGFEITSDDLSLYAAGSSTPIVSTGPYDPQTTAAPTLTSPVGPGDYVLVDTVVVPTGDKGAFTVDATVTSPAPEPASWALMLMGVGAAGGMLRLRRQGKTSALAGFAA